MIRRAVMMHMLLAVVGAMSGGVLWPHTPFAHATGRQAALVPVVTCPQLPLPANFDPIQASSSELMAMHLPPRPTEDSAQVTAWAIGLRNIKQFNCARTFEHGTSQLPISARHKIQGGYSVLLSDNWSGWFVYNDTFDQVHANWNTQCPGTPIQLGSREGTWVGLGGINTQTLVQVGTAYHTNPNTGQLYYYMFLQLIAPGTNYLWFDLTDPLGCGQGIYAEVYPSGTNSWCVDVRWSNVTNGTCYSVQADTSTAEWIDDRPVCSNGVSYLYNFNYTQYTNAYAHSTTHNWHTIGGFPNERIVMQDSYGNTFAYPDGALGSGANNFQDHYAAPGTDGVQCANL